MNTGQETFDMKSENFPFEMVWLNDFGDKFSLVTFLLHFKITCFIFSFLFCVSQILAILSIEVEQFNKVPIVKSAH